jgi:hypothetical protein
MAMRSIAVRSPVRFATRFIVPTAEAAALDGPQYDGINDGDSRDKL